MGKQIELILASEKICGIDTMPFIYLLEKHQTYFSIVEKIFRLIEKEKIKTVTSVITPIEILSTPLLEKFPQKQKLYLSFFTKLKNLKVIDLTFDLIENVSRLRRKYLLRTPDSIQIATSLSQQANLFITNDKRLKKIKEIKTVLLDEFL